MNYHNFSAPAIILVVASTFYLFNAQFFLFAAEIDNKKVTRIQRIMTFAITYIWFFIVSLLQLPLYINWLLFLVIQIMQVHYVFSYSYTIAGALSCFSLIIGLAINGLARSTFALLLNLPLNAFDNVLPTLKQYPIAFGFLISGIFFFVMRRLKLQKKVANLIHEPQSISFFLKVELCLYIFLELHLLLYSQYDDLTGNKLWGIKISLFCLIMLVITSIYALRVSALHIYMDKQHQIHQQLIDEKENIDNLWKLAYSDMLTGCNNSMLLKKRMKEYEGYGGSLTLGFIDLNGLKAVNDQYGHLEGDYYLMCAASKLTEIFQNVKADVFRFGGDEFVVLSDSLSSQQMDALLVQANDELVKIQHLYTMSACHGVSHGSSSDSERLLQEADKKMYEHKLKYYEKNAGK